MSAPSLWRQHILPFSALVGLLAAGTLIGDYLLHRLGLVWIGRYLGIPGTILILASLTYSLHKRKRISWGEPKRLVNFHEFAAWLGSLLVLMHAGIHFNAILPWLATVAMGINVISGMVGKILLNRSLRHVQQRRDRFQLRGLPLREAERALFWDAVALDAMAKWRRIHIPISIAFAALALGHIVSIFLFWGWR